MSKQAQYVQKYTKNRKTDLISVFHSKCCICGFDQFQAALEFHHIDPNSKKFGLSSKSRGRRTLEEQLMELKKCILLCANCHRGIHNQAIKLPENAYSFYDETVADELRKKLQQFKTRKIFKCQNCNKEISYGATLCNICQHLKERVTDWPDRDKLKHLIRMTPMTQIGKQYGVSDNAIRKWCIAYNLPSKKSEIKKYSDEEWEKI